MACGMQDDICVIMQNGDGETVQSPSNHLENNPIGIKRKINPKDEIKPNIPIRRKAVGSSELENFGTSVEPKREKLLGHFKKHFLARCEDEDGDETDEQVPPQKLLEPVIPPTERFGLDLTPTLQTPFLAAIYRRLRILPGTPAVTTASMGTLPVRSPLVPPAH